MASGRQLMQIGIGSRGGFLLYFPPTPPDTRVRIRRFGMLRFPRQADLSAVALSSPTVLVPHFAVLLGFTLPSSESSADVRGLLWNTTEIRSMPFSFPFAPSPLGPKLALGRSTIPEARRYANWLLWPLLTSRSAVNNFPRRRPFRHKARSPQVIPFTVPARAPDLRSLTLDRESFAVMCPLALVGHASYPIPVRHPAGLATPLLSATRSRSSPCGSLKSLRSTSQTTYTSK